MKNGEQKNELSHWEIKGLVILGIVFYVAGFKLLMAWEDRFYPSFFEDNPCGLSYFIVLGFDVGWIVMMKRWRLNRHIKAVLTCLVIVLSALIITDLHLINMFHTMW